MPTPDADIPQAFHGDQILLIAPQPYGPPLLITHHLEDGDIMDPRLHALPVRLRIEGISEEAVERISHALQDVQPPSPLPSRRQLLSNALS